VRSERASIVIPACNEEEHLGGLLDSLVAAAERRPLSIVVVCNGCTDRTEDVARAFSGVEVLVSEVAAKHAALNAGDDRAGDAFPRFYADGDIRIDPESMVRLLAALDVEAPRAAGPRVHYDLSHSPWLAGAFVRTNERLPFHEHWHATRLQGRGIYGTNRAGRARFDRFPAIRSDDGFFDLFFDDDERVVVDDASVTVSCPTSVGQLLRNQTRVAEGFQELGAWSRANHPGGASRFEGADGKGWRDADLWRHSAFVAGLRRGTGVPDAVGFATVEVMTRTNALVRRALGREVGWR
jgi:hypothetical protein